MKRIKINLFFIYELIEGGSSKMSDTAIELRDVSMKFRLANEKIDSLKEFVIKSLKKNIRYREFYALKSVNLTIKKGERVGIIGANGAGKSTLLKVIAGVMKPTSGEVLVNGTIAPLLELGAGFDPELSGAENIYLNGAILGKSKEFLQEKYNEIVEYADIGEFIYSPIKNYSSGMRARLGFSIAICVDPDILIVDEILGVGDEQFKQKSSNTMRELMDSGKTVLLVSHSLNQIKKLTEKVIWLNKGQVRMIGPSEVVCKSYEDYVRSMKNKI